jgi:hypothetical protein
MDYISCLANVRNRTHIYACACVRDRAHTRGGVPGRVYACVCVVCASTHIWRKKNFAKQSKKGSKVVSR